jgi:predicted nucleic acid-binding protein
MRFVDTNVLMYSVSPTLHEKAKRDIADAILDSDDLCLSVQVLQEFYTQATRPTRAGRLRADEAATLVSTWRRLRIVDLTITIVERAITASQRWQISYWDAAIIESARTAGCATVLSEDLQHGQNFDGVRVVNPFHTA